MNKRRKTNRWLLVATLSACALPVQFGCRRLGQPRELTALTQPTVLTVPAKAEPQGVAGKAKAAAVETAKLAGVVVVGVVVFGLGLWLDDDDDEGEGSRAYDPDPHWRQGYGYNNPNPERIREGKDVLNFDGSVAK